MTDKIKLIIEIPEEIMEYVKINGWLSAFHIDEVAKAIKNGTPLDDVKAEIDKAQEPYKTSTAYDEGVRFGLMLAYQIIDKYKVESEGK